MSSSGLDTEGDPAIKEWIDGLTQKLEGSSNASAKRSTLYQLSVRMSEPISIRNPFTPTIVSIGILHKENKTTSLMEEQKWGYLNSFLSRSTLAASSGTQQVDKNSLLKACVHSIANLESELRLWCVNEYPIPCVIETFLLDGCFILELLVRYYEVFKLLLTPDYQDNPLFKPIEDREEDPILEFNWILSAVRNDLALLENQMPFMVLQKLFELVTGRNSNLPHDFLVELVSKFFEPVHQQANPLVPVLERNLHRAHLLNILLNIFRPTTETQAGAQLSSRNHRQRLTPRKTFLESATSLDVVGVRFTPGTGNLLDIKFHHQGKFEIPPLHITEWTGSFFRNLIAFERCCPDRRPYVASYLLIMNRLIADTADVALLERRGILINDLGSNKDILELLKNIGSQIDVLDEYYQRLCDSLDSSYNNMWNVYKKQLRYQYFSSPWAVVSMTAAMVLLISVLLQTIFIISIYYRRL